MTFNPIQSIDRMLVAKCFVCARNTYGRETHVQQQVAEKMLRLLMEYAGKHSATPNSTDNTLSCPESISPFRKATELGCRTGCYSRLLLHTLQPESLLFNDLYPEMEECIKNICDWDSKGRIKFVPCDMKTLEFPQETDLITSCSTLQWFADTRRFFARYHRFLSDGGIPTFSTFGRQNVQEIHTLTGNGLEYLPLDSLKKLLSPPFEIIHAEEEIVVLPSGTPLEVLQHLKQTGATDTKKRVWTHGRLQNFYNEYVRIYSNAGHSISLTYHPICIITRKRIEQGEEAYV